MSHPVYDIPTHGSRLVPDSGDADFEERLVKAVERSPAVRDAIIRLFDRGLLRRVRPIAERKEQR